MDLEYMIPAKRKSNIRNQFVPAKVSFYLPYFTAYTTNCQISIKYICILDSSVAQRDRTSSPCLCVKMPDLETQENKPPAGYTVDTPTTGKKCFPRTKKEGRKRLYRGMPLRSMLLLDL
ncbi:hypothetical protein POTOM_024744 [Populus tomentosa]|uniref:Uncharacterized protein n=1 Tax=Populus tomentosa TaxID=118781 RepID=A0A8X7ZMW8_POPTO|nr:hypothetical protein POTOM_024744 [Populus tomentosa]